MVWKPIHVIHTYVCINMYRYFNMVVLHNFDFQGLLLQHSVQICPICGATAATLISYVNSKHPAEVKSAPKWTFRGKPSDTQ